MKQYSFATNKNSIFRRLNLGGRFLIGLLFLTAFCLSVSGTLAIADEGNFPGNGQHYLPGDFNHEYIPYINQLSEAGLGSSIENVNWKGFYDIGDAIGILEYHFFGEYNGPEDIDPHELGDFNQDGTTNANDAIALLTYLFIDNIPPDTGIRVTGEVNSLTLFTEKTKIFLQAEDETVVWKKEDHAKITLLTHDLALFPNSCPEGEGILGMFLSIYDPWDPEKSQSMNDEIDYVHQDSGDPALASGMITFLLPQGYSAAFMPLEWVCKLDGSRDYPVLNKEMVHLYHDFNGIVYMKRALGSWKRMSTGPFPKNGGGDMPNPADVAREANEKFNGQGPPQAPVFAKPPSPVPEQEEEDEPPHPPLCPSCQTSFLTCAGTSGHNALTGGWNLTEAELVFYCGYCDNWKWDEDPIGTSIAYGFGYPIHVTLAGTAYVASATCRCAYEIVAAPVKFFMWCFSD